jgi:hypothetical protein
MSKVEVQVTPPKERCLRATYRLASIEGNKYVLHVYEARKLRRPVKKFTIELTYDEIPEWLLNIMVMLSFAEEGGEASLPDGVFLIGGVIWVHPQIIWAAPQK